MVVMCSSLVPRLAGMFHELQSRDREITLAETEEIQWHLGKMPGAP